MPAFLLLLLFTSAGGATSPFLMRVYTTPLRTHCSPATSHLPLHTHARTQHAAWDSLHHNDAITKDGGRAAIIAANHNPFLEEVVFTYSSGGTYEPTEATRTALYTRIIKADPDAEFARMKAALESDGGGGAGNGGLTPAQTAVFLQTAISGDIDRATFFLQQLVSIDKRKERAEQPALQGRLRTGDFAALPEAWLDRETETNRYGRDVAVDQKVKDARTAATLAAIKTAGHASAPPTALQAFAFDLHKVAGTAKLPVFGSNASLLTALAAANKPQLSNTLVFKAATEHFWQSSAKYFFWAAAATHLVELALVLFVALEHKYWTVVPSPAVTSALWFIAVAAGVQAVGVAAEMAGALAKRHFFQQVANVWFILRTVRVVLALAACCLVLGALPPAAAGPHPFAGNGSLANSSSATADSTTTATTTTTTFTTTTTTSTLAGALPPAIMTVEEAGATAAVFAWVSLTTCFGSLYYLLPHPKFGPLVLMIVRILADTWRFIFVLLIVTVGLAVSMLVNARGAHQGGGDGVGFGDDDADAMLFASPTGSLLHSVGYFVFGALDFEGINTLAGSPYASAAISMLLGGFVLLVMLMNLLIALLSDSYERAQDEAEAMFWLSKLQIVVAIQHSPARLGWYVLRTWVPYVALGLVALVGVVAVLLLRLLCGWFFWREGNAAPFGLDGTFESLWEWYDETLMEPANPFDYFDHWEDGPGSTPKKLAVLIPKTATVHSKPDQWQGMLSDIKAAVHGATNDIKENFQEELKVLHAAIAAPQQAGSGSSSGGSSNTGGAPQTEQGPLQESGAKASNAALEAKVATGISALGDKLSEASADAKAMNVALEEKMAASNAVLEAKVASLESTMATTVSTLAEILALVKQNNNAAQAASTAGGMVEQTMTVKRMVPAAQAGSLVVSTPAIDADDEYTGFQGIDAPVASRGGGKISPQEFGFGTGDF